MQVTLDTQKTKFTQINKVSILAAALLLLSGITTVAQINLPKMRVVSVGDGDTQSWN
ncbi:hypothetical protein H6H03_39545 [Nostoc paludosum FACHB-159]|uniref:Uncharacterized protein n=1 Tax=Nostoc paludosum FACHB-159 TaxID=2692908 RepID=A0ABR8KMQ9_9NOSO|nr:hypothetical protein [Nostoc paludosum FACHB-159]